jgi:excisionase family DNA binding protein
MDTKTLPSASFDSEDFLRIEPAAGYLKVSVRWLRHGINHRGFPHHRMGRLIVFSREDLAQIAAMHHRPAKPRRARVAA